MTDTPGSDGGTSPEPRGGTSEPPPTPSEATTEPIAEATPPSDEEVRALKEERDRLRQERDDLAERAKGERRSKLRTVFTVVLVVVALVSLAGAMPGAWARRTLRDTDRYVDVVSEVAQQPAVQAYLAARITDQAFVALDVQGRLSTALGNLDERLTFLAAPITQSVRDLVREQVEKLIASPAFQELWASANRVAHDQIVAVLNGDESNAVQLTDGKVVINTLPLVNQALQGVSDLASELLGRTVTLPEITADMIPSESVGKLETALGVDLPDNFGTIEIYDSDTLAEVQQTVNAANRLIVLFVILFFLASAGALALSQRRRRTLLQLMTGAAIVLVIERRSVIVALDGLVEDAAPEAQAAVRAAADVLLSDFLRYTGWVLAIALITIAIALLTGPYPWAVWLRKGIAD
ncbi:MAG: hypothetical protein ACXWW5_01525, partial [Actinomycetota bacterium]